MELFDFKGRKITKGTTLKYLRTSTTGIAEDIRFDCGEAWIRLDSTGLYYHSEYLRVVKPVKEINKRNNSPTPHKLVHQIFKSKKKLKESPNMISDYPDGPGYGGG